MPVDDRVEGVLIFANPTVPRSTEPKSYTRPYVQLGTTRRARPLTSRMRAPVLASLLALCTSACGGPKPPQPVRATALAAPAAVEPAVAAPEAPEPTVAPAALPPLGPLPAELKRPDDIACSFRTTAFRGKKPGTTIALRDGGKPFAKVWGTVEADIHVRRGPASTNTVMEATASGIALRGFTPSQAIELRPANGFVLDDIAIATSKARLSIVSAKGHQVEVQLPRPVELASKDRTLEATRPCEDLGLDEVRFTAEPVVFGDKKGHTMLLKPGVTTVRLAPTGVAAGAFATKESAFVNVYDTVEGMSHITWALDDVVLFGWVDTRRLEHQNIGRGMTGGRGSLGAGRGNINPQARVFCSWDVPLVGEVGTDRAVVGRILAGTTIDVIAWDDENEPFARVDVNRAAIMPETGARWLARGDELRRCKPEALD